MRARLVVAVLSLASHAFAAPGADDGTSPASTGTLVARDAAGKRTLCILTGCKDPNTFCNGITCSTCSAGFWWRQGDKDCSSCDEGESVHRHG
jgi:hypothetical protein